MEKRRCTALRKDGKPCRAWAVHKGLQVGPARPGGAGGDGKARPALCSAHGGLAPFSAVEATVSEKGTLEPIVVEAFQAGRFYDDLYKDHEFAALQVMEHEMSVMGEVGLVRVALRRLMVDFGTEHGLAPSEMNERAVVLFRGAEAVARMVQLERGLAPEDEDEIPEWMASALDDLGEEYGLEL